MWDRGRRGEIGRITPIEGKVKAKAEAELEGMSSKKDMLEEGALEAEEQRDAEWHGDEEQPVPAKVLQHDAANVGADDAAQRQQQQHPQAAEEMQRMRDDHERDCDCDERLAMVGTGPRAV